MRVGLRILKPETVAWLRRELQRGELSRAALGRELCSRDGWRNPRGALCAASARKALPHLAEQLRLSLPRALAGPPRRGCGPRVDGLRLALTEFCGSLGGAGGGPAAGGGHGVGAEAVRAAAGGGAPARPGAGAGLPADVSAGVGGGSAGRTELRGVGATVGAARRAPGLGRPHAGGPHRAGGLQRPFSGAAGGAGAALGVAHAGSCNSASGGGLGSAARAAAGAGGDVRGGVAAGNELSGGGLGVRGPDGGSSARVAGCGRAEVRLAAGSGSGLGGDVAGCAGACAGVVSGPCLGRRGRLGAARVCAFGLGRRAFAAASGTVGGGLGAASGPAAAGGLSRRSQKVGGRWG